MNRISRLVGIAACAVLPAVAHAQTSTTRPVSFGVMGGAAVPIGDLGDAVDLGYTLGAHVLLSPSSLPSLGIRADVTYTSWNEKGILNSVVNSKTRNIGVMGNVILKSSAAMAMKPYALGGLGLVNSKRSGSIGGFNVDGASESNLGAQVGGGLEFALSGFTTFVEAKFVNAFATKSVHWIPITFGVRF